MNPGGAGPSTRPVRQLVSARAPARPPINAAPSRNPATTPKKKDIDVFIESLRRVATPYIKTNVGLRFLDKLDTWQTKPLELEVLKRKGHDQLIQYIQFPKLEDASSVTRFSYYDFAKPVVTDAGITLKLTPEGTAANGLVRDVASLLGMNAARVPVMTDLVFTTASIANRASSRTTFHAKLEAYTASLLDDVYSVTIEMLNIHTTYEATYTNTKNKASNGLITTWAAGLFKLVKCHPDIARHLRPAARAVVSTTLNPKSHNLNGLRMKLRGLNMVAVKRLATHDTGDAVATRLNERNTVALKRFDLLVTKYDAALATHDEYTRLRTSIDDAYDFINPAIRMGTANMNRNLTLAEKQKCITMALETYKAELAEITGSLPTPLRRACVQDTITSIASPATPATPATGRTTPTVAAPKRPPTDTAIDRAAASIETLQREMTVDSASFAKTDTVVREYETTIRNMRTDLAKAQAARNQTTAMYTTKLAAAQARIGKLAARVKSVRDSDARSRADVHSTRAQLAVNKKERTDLARLVKKVKLESQTTEAAYKAKLKRVTRDKQAQLDALKSRLEKKKRRVRDMEVSLQTSSGRVRDRNSKVRASRLEAQRLERMVKDLRATIRTHTIQTKASIAVHRKRSAATVRGMEQRLRRLKTTLTSAVADGRTKDRVIAAHVKSLDMLTAKLAQSRRTVKKTATALVDVESSIRVLSEDLQSMTRERNRLERRIRSTTRKLRTARLALASLAFASSLVATIPFFMRVDTHASTQLIQVSSPIPPTSRTASRAEIRAVDVPSDLGTTRPRRLEGPAALNVRGNTTLVAQRGIPIGFTPFPVQSMETDPSNLILLGFLAALVLGIGTNFIKRIRTPRGGIEVWNESIVPGYDRVETGIPGRYTSTPTSTPTANPPQYSVVTTSMNTGYESNNGRGWGKGHGRYGLRPSRRRN